MIKTLLNWYSQRKIAHIRSDTNIIYLLNLNLPFQKRKYMFISNKRDNCWKEQYFVFNSDFTGDKINGFYSNR